MSFWFQWILKKTISFIFQRTFVCIRLWTYLKQFFLPLKCFARCCLQVNPSHGWDTSTASTCQPLNCTCVNSFLGLNLIVCHASKHFSKLNWEGNYNAFLTPCKVHSFQILREEQLTRSFFILKSLLLSVLVFIMNITPQLRFEIHSNASTPSTSFDGESNHEGLRTELFPRFIVPTTVQCKISFRRKYLEVIKPFFSFIYFATIFLMWHSDK